MSEMLKPCPFCGGKAKQSEKNTHGGTTWKTLHCGDGEDCPAFLSGYSWEELKRAWNRRAGGAALVWSTEPPKTEGFYVRIQYGWSGPWEVNVRKDQVGQRWEPSWWLGPLPSWRDLGSPLLKPVEPPA